jgi:orotidine-5'-phosphate decarboxylase
LCVGLDPRWESLPHEVRSQRADTLEGRAAGYSAFCQTVLDLVAPYVAVVKPQSAFFEACGPAGMQSLLDVMRHARQLGLLTILDAKRGDIASTAAAYAEMAFNTYDADALTVNPYLGRDSIEPFLKVARPLGRGLFVLVRTSNPGAGQFQDLQVDGRPLHRQVGAAVESWSLEDLGTRGFGDVGAVVGATSPRELSELRSLMPHVPILVPGYGAQGGTASDVVGAFQAGQGAIVNSSRAILFSYATEERNWREAIVQATRHTVRDLAMAIPA